MSDKNIEEYLDIATGRFVIDMFPEIPDFLDRRDGKPPRRSVKRRRKYKCSLPKNKNRVKENVVTLHLSDEAPRIGSGFRQVEIVSRGPKWVTVRSWPGGPTAAPVNHRFPVKHFESYVR